MRKAVIRKADGHVENIIEYSPSWQPPDGCEVRDPGPGCEPGGTWDGRAYKPRPVANTSLTQGEQAIVDRARLDPAFAEIARRFGLKKAS